jgi:predicted ATPase/DNA-binding CsgD family transcriptional regulator/TolA-binding protein
VAASSRGRFSDGAYFISLAPISNPDLVLSTIAQILGVREAPDQPLLQSLCSALHDRHLLLILDNFEQVLSAGPQILDLLLCAPHLHALVTSRAVLHVYGEHEYQVLPLSLPDLDAVRQPSVEQLTQHEAVRLFIERARAVKPDFAVTTDNAPSVAEICRRLDGLPLAIELAAARIRLLSPRALLQRLDPALPLLTNGAALPTYRHLALSNAVAWSYDLLDQAEKELFRSLSVFVGGCTLEAAEAVSLDATDHAPQSALDRLAALVDKSLLQHEEQDDGEPRFSMLETIREFALEHLALCSESEAVRRKYANYHVRWGEQIRPDLAGPELATWLGRLELDRANLRAALTWLLEQGEAGDAGAAEDALRLLMSLTAFWNSVHPSEQEKWLEKALAHVGPEPTDLRVRGLRWASVMARWQNAFPRAKAWAEEAVAVAEELGDKRLLTSALYNRAIDDIMEGDYSAARTLLERCLAVYQELGDHSYTAATLVDLGEVARYQGDYERAESLYVESLKIFKALSQPTGILAATVNLGQAAQHLGKYREARAIFLEALALAQEIDRPERAATVLTGLAGVILAELDQPTRAAPQILRDLEQIACLAGLAAGLLERRGRVLEPPDQIEFDHNVAVARAHLGEEAFTAAWEAGKAFSLTDALALALGELSPDVPRIAAPSPAEGVSQPAEPGSTLTPREIEVLQLVAAGLTNAGIASHLHVSINTVRTHLASIFDKINVKTRGAAVRYAFEHSLA